MFYFDKINFLYIMCTYLQYNIPKLNIPKLKWALCAFSIPPFYKKLLGGH